MTFSQNPSKCIKSIGSGEKPPRQTSQPDIHPNPSYPRVDSKDIWFDRDEERIEKFIQHKLLL